MYIHCGRKVDAAEFQEVVPLVPIVEDVTPTSIQQQELSAIENIYCLSLGGSRSRDDITDCSLRRERSLLISGKPFRTSHVEKYKFIRTWKLLRKPPKHNYVIFCLNLDRVLTTELPRQVTSTTLISSIGNDELEAASNLNAIELKTTPIPITLIQGCIPKYLKELAMCL